MTLIDLNLSGTMFGLRFTRRVRSGGIFEWIFCSGIQFTRQLSWHQGLIARQYRAADINKKCAARSTNYTNRKGLIVEKYHDTDDRNHRQHHEDDPSRATLQ